MFTPEPFVFADVSSWCSPKSEAFVLIAPFYVRGPILRIVLIDRR